MEEDQWHHDPPLLGRLLMIIMVISLRPFLIIINIMHVMRVLKHFLSSLQEIGCKLTLIVIVAFISAELTYMLSLLRLSWILTVSCI